jgi:DHA2 family multidrug resistance protein
MGLALLGVFIDRETSTQVQSIGSAVSANSVMAQTRMAGQAAGFATQGGDQASGQLQALGQLSQTIQQQAVVITYSDCFWLLGVAMIAMIPLVFLLRPPPASVPLSDAAH